MTTEQLTACRCALRDADGLDSMAEARTEDGSGLRSVVSVTYICPLGEQGLARVSVTNGIVDAVYR